jgi:ATP phosphoribosyltransferase regulatory subunit
VDTTASTNVAVDARSAALIASFERAGYRRLAPPVLQPAAPFLDLSGEDIRARMYLTADAQGNELCLRPDLTIPVSREYLAGPAAGTPQAFCYLGQVFRQRRSDGQGATEFWQAGIESFGRPDKPAADAEMLALALHAAAHFGLASPSIRMGDIGLFSALVAALDLAPAWKRRLIKDFNHKKSLLQDLQRLSIASADARPEYQGVLAALAGSDPKGAHALITDLLSIAGITTVGGRSIGEIAERFLDQAALGAQPSLPQATRTLIEQFLALNGAPDQVLTQLRRLARNAGLAFDHALEDFAARIRFLVERGIDSRRISFSTALGRGLDYYTGMVFELHDPQKHVAGQLVAGGRYDGLLTRLGSPRPIAAVGFAVWVERLAALGGQA